MDQRKAFLGGVRDAGDSGEENHKADRRSAGKESGEVMAREGGEYVTGLRRWGWGMRGQPWRRRAEGLDIC